MGSSSELSNPSVHHQRSSSAAEASTTTPLIQRFGSKNNDLPSPIPPVRTKKVAALREMFMDTGNGLRNESYLKANNESLDLNPTGLRNESYMKATHDTLNESDAYTLMLPSSP